MGDIHGDLNLAVRFFMLADLIDQDENWIADPPDTVVVQVGDQIDSCRPTPDNNCHLVTDRNDRPDDIRVIDLFDRIDRKARAKGGAVYSMLGNHELMNVQGNMAYVSYANHAQFHYQGLRGLAGRKRAFAPGGPLAVRLAKRPSILIIGSTMFAHAGALPVLLDRLDHLDVTAEQKLGYLNDVVRRWLMGQRTSWQNIDLVNSDISPFWTRVYGTIKPSKPLKSMECEDLKRALQVYKIGSMVVGHTPQAFQNNTGINGTCYNGDRPCLFRVDAGCAQAFKKLGNRQYVQVLEILDDTTFKVISGSTY